MAQWGRSIAKGRSTGRYQVVVGAVVLSMTYAVLLIGAHMHDMITDGVDVMDPDGSDLERLALYLSPVHPNLSDWADDVAVLIRSYVAGENVLDTHRARVDEVWRFVAQERDALSGVGLAAYSDLLDTVAALYPYREEIYDLMGNNGPRHYLFVLQNTGESRPNGGFFGSFVLLTLDNGAITSFVPVDSYFPDSLSDFRLAGEEWADPLFSQTEVGFVAGNKYGFTRLDGRNLKVLYEEIFARRYDESVVQSGPYRDVWPQLSNKNISGVIFLRSDTMQRLVPSFDRKVREWQFVNATIDLIRGEDLSNKKELYLEDLSVFFAENRVGLLLAGLSEWGSIQGRREIQMYLPTISPALMYVFIDQKLVTTYQPNTLYTWDYNRTFSKIDHFVNKQVRILDSINQLVVRDDQDIIQLPILSPGRYTMQIDYDVSVPQVYEQYIQRLTDLYEVDLTIREEVILSLRPNFAGDMRATQGVVHYPSDRELIDVVGGEDIIQTNTPFSNVVSYDVRTPLNNTRLSVRVIFEVPET